MSIKKLRKAIQFATEGDVAKWRKILHEVLKIKVIKKLDEKEKELAKVILKNVKVKK